MPLAFLSWAASTTAWICFGSFGAGCRVDWFGV